ncbi:MAG: hypothetical protein ABII72_01640 [Parcubacteria group bacterium]
MAVFGVTQAADELEKPALPTVKIKTVPQTVHPGAKIALLAEHENFLGGGVFDNWCIDGKPLNTFYAGSSDKITMVVVDWQGKEYPDGTKIVRKKNAKNVEEVYIETVEKDSKGKNFLQPTKVLSAKYVPKITNEWGRLYGGAGLCESPPWPIGSQGWYDSGLISDHFSQDQKTVTEEEGIATMIGFENITFTNPRILAKKMPSQGANYQMAEKDDSLPDPLDKDKKAFTVDSSGSYRCLSKNDADSYTEKMIGLGYEVVESNKAQDKISVNCPSEQALYLIYESYAYLDIGAVLDSDTTEVLWNKRQGGKVKVRYMSFPQVSYDEEGFKKFWQENFNEVPSIVIARAQTYPECVQSYYDREIRPYGDDVASACAHNIRHGRSFAAAFGKIYSKWSSTESAWLNNRAKISKGEGDKIRINLARAFSRLDDTEANIQKEGKIVESGPDKGLVGYKDRDKDGMPDLWEMKYFGSMAGKEVKKGDNEIMKVYFPPCCNADDKEKRPREIEDFLLSVQAGDDWDNDKFDFSPYASSTEEMLKLGIGPSVEYSRNEQGGNGTNYFEFVIGTDPTIADTDSDGVPDVADYYGMEQNSVQLRLNKAKTGEDYSVIVRSYGKATRSVYKGEATFARADSHSIMKEGGGLSLQVMLSVTPSNVTIADNKVMIKAAVGNLENVDPNSLFYQWYLNDYPVPSATGSKYSSEACPCNPTYFAMAEALGKQSGFGKSTLEFTASQGVSQPCVGAKVMLEVTDPKTEQTTMTTAEIPVLMDLNFTKEVVCNDNSQKTGGCDDPANDKSKKDVNSSEKGGFRQYDKVKYTAELDGYDENTCGVETGAKTSSSDSKEAKTTTFTDNLTYRWSVDGVEQKDKSGKGKDFQSIQVEPTAGAVASVNDKGTSASDPRSKDSHYVEVQIYDGSNKLVARKQEGIKVLAAYAELKPTKGFSKGPTQKDGTVTYSAKRGTKVEVKATAQYFLPVNKQKFVYTWYRNGEKVDTSTTTNRIGTMEFTAGDNKQSSEVIKVQIDSLDDKGQKPEGSITTITLEVTEDSTAGGVSGAKSFIESFVPDNVRNVFNVFITLSIAALVLVFASGAVGSRGRD